MGESKVGVYSRYTVVGLYSEWIDIEVIVIELEHLYGVTVSGHI